MHLITYSLPPSLHSPPPHLPPQVHIGSPLLSLTNLSSLSPHNFPAPTPVAIGMDHDNGHQSTSPPSLPPSLPPSPPSAKVRVFCSTCNVGGCTDLRSFGPISAWVPLGYDLYIIGFQVRASSSLPPSLPPSFFERRLFLKKMVVVCSQSFLPSSLPPSPFSRRLSS